MICPKCEAMMDSMGYGDEMCPVCGHAEYSESRDEFNLRIYGTTFRETEETKDEGDSNEPT
jgi:tRNA(Ile2) C34 agmatinyltransferase TiaS